MSEDCGLSAAAAPDRGGADDDGGAVSPDEDNAETGSVIEDSVETAEPRGEHAGGSMPPSSMLLRLPLGDTFGVPFGVAWRIRDNVKSIYI